MTSRFSCGFPEVRGTQTGKLALKGPLVYEGVRIVRQSMSNQRRVLTRWMCVLAVMCSQFGLFTLNAAAQEPTTEPTPLPTPTSAPTWTPAPTPTNTPDPARTPTANPTAATRMVDFRADDDKIPSGECVMFSWQVRGDIDTVEFDQIGDGKEPLLVSDMDSREECPEETTTYELIVTWLDSSQTTRSIEIEVEDDSNGGSGGSSGTATPSGTAAFVPVTPIPVIGTPVSTVDPAATSVSYGGVVVTPIGALGSVQVLPETGYLSSPHDERTDQAGDDLPTRTFWWALAGGLAAVLALVVIGSALGRRVVRAREVTR